MGRHLTSDLSISPFLPAKTSSTTVTPSLVAVYGVILHKSPIVLGAKALKLILAQRTILVNARLLRA